MATADMIDHRSLAISLNQRTWALLESKTRTADEDSEMVHVSHASLWHWMQAGTPANIQRGEWLIGRVYVVLGRSEPALHQAKRTTALTRSHARDLEDFDIAYSHELMARALWLSDARSDAIAEWERAKQLGRAIAGEKDREIFEADCAAIPFPGETAGEPV